MVWRLDRLGRSLRHLLETVADLESRGVAFTSLTENIDTATPGGKLVFNLFGALAEFEAALIRERTMAGLAAARARGRTGGRPTVWTAEKLATARRARLPDPPIATIVTHGHPPPSHPVLPETCRQGEPAPSRSANSDPLSQQALVEVAVDAAGPELGGC